MEHVCARNFIMGMTVEYKPIFAQTIVHQMVSVELMGLAIASRGFLEKTVLNWPHSVLMVV